MLFQESGEEWNMHENHGEWDHIPHPEIYICKSCGYSFVARPPNYGYGKHYPDDVKDKSVKTRVKTSLRKASSLFHIIGNVIISHETIRRYVPPALPGIMESSGYFVYDEQYTQ